MATRARRARKPGCPVGAYPPPAMLAWTMRPIGLNVRAGRSSSMEHVSAPNSGSRVERGNAEATDVGDRLIFLAEALTLVPFSETTLRRAIRRGELEAWQPHDDGKLVLRRNSLIEWATRRPARDPTESAGHAKPRSTKPAARRPRRAVAAIERPDPIRLADVG